MADAAAPTRKQRNWWKTAFFVALFAFEVAREWAVMATYEDLKVATAPSVTLIDNYASASGSWVRTDGGDKLVKNAVSIRCSGSLGICMEAQATGHDGYIYSPSLDYFAAEFTPGAVTYRNTDPTCVTYEVRLDGSQDRALATRKKKPEAANKPECKAVEESVQMLLGNGFEHKGFDGHFVPVLQGLLWLLSLLD